MCNDSDGFQYEHGERTIAVFVSFVDINKGIPLDLHWIDNCLKIVGICRFIRSFIRSFFSSWDYFAFAFKAYARFVCDLCRFGICDFAMANITTFSLTASLSLSLSHSDLLSSLSSLCPLLYTHCNRFIEWVGKMRARAYGFTIKVQFDALLLSFKFTLITWLAFISTNIFSSLLLLFFFFFKILSLSVANAVNSMNKSMKWKQVTATKATMMTKKT